MKLNSTSEKRICILGPPPNEKGGVARATLLYINIFKNILKYNTILVPHTLLDVLRNPGILKLLRLCNVIHLQRPQTLPLLVLFTTARRPRIILTLHGWVIKETLLGFSRFSKKTYRELFGLISYIILWSIYRHLLIRSIIDYVTSVSGITARENGINEALIVPNPILCRPLDSCRTHHSIHYHNFRIVTYVSIGGGKIESVPTAVAIVNHVNKLLKMNNLQMSVTLEIYGKDIPDYILRIISHVPFVKYMGYVSDFKGMIKGADLFLIPYTFPELGFAVLEAICMGIPIAKLTADPTEEEIIDGFNGILATSPYEMVVKIYNYLLKKDEQNCYIAKNAITTILKKRDPQVISLYWKYIFESLLGHGR
jgi:glycosyltransferase involved in cell wall biosynthesis